MSYRLRKEFMDFPSQVPDASCHLVDQSLDHWLLSFPFRSDILTIHLIFKEDYPFKAPLLWIESPRLIQPPGSTFASSPEYTQFKGFTLFSGVPCWSLIGDDWVASMSVKTILLQFRELLDRSGALPDPAGGSYPRTLVDKGRAAIERYHKEWFKS